MPNVSSFRVLDLFYHEEVMKPYSPPVPTEAPFRLPTAKDITLAEFDPSCQGAITAHKLKDYRQRHYSLVLIPDLEIVLDEILKPLEVDLNEFLQTAGVNV